MLMMPLSVPSRPEKGPTDADDALAGALTPRKGGQLMLTMLALPGSHAQEGGQLMLMMRGPHAQEDA